jgi:hypothetical protein
MKKKVKEWLTLLLSKESFSTQTVLNLASKDQNTNSAGGRLVSVFLSLLKCLPIQAQNFP